MDMQCREIRALFGPFLDGELPRQESSEVKEHLKRCPACRYELEKERTIVEMLTTLPELQCSEKVVQRIEEITLNEVKRKSLRERIKFKGETFRWRTAAVGFAVAVVLLLFVARPFLEREESMKVEYSQEEMLKSRAEAKLSLGYIARMIDRTEKNIIEDVLLKELPKTVRKSIRNTVPLFKGGQR